MKLARMFLLVVPLFFLGCGRQGNINEASINECSADLLDSNNRIADSFLRADKQGSDLDKRPFYEETLSLAREFRNHYGGIVCKAEFTNLKTGKSSVQNFNVHERMDKLIPLLEKMLNLIDALREQEQHKEGHRNNGPIARSAEAAPLRSSLVPFT